MGVRRRGRAHGGVLQREGLTASLEAEAEQIAGVGGLPGAVGLG
jgi:hypothetical protein